MTKRRGVPLALDDGRSTVPAGPTNVAAPEGRRLTPARIAGAVLRRARRLAIRLFGRTRFLSAMYYFLMSRAFDREHRATMQGRIRYDAEARRARNHRYLLRRRIHMLEKGLVMRPRRPTFALDYIGETVGCYADMIRTQAQEPGLVDPFDLLWAHDVLATYFGVVASHPTIDAARSRFEGCSVPCGLEPGSSRRPYARDVEEASPVAYDDLLDLARRRRSVRWYLPEPVPREVIDRAITVASLAPSACNRQPFEFRVYDDPELVRRIGEIPAGTRGFASNLPVLIVVVGKLAAFFDERDRHLIYIDGALASMSLVLAAEALGLSTCCINWADVEDRERAMERLLGLAAHDRVVMLIAVGYADPVGMVPYSEKKSLDHLRSFNRQ